MTVFESCRQDWVLCKIAEFEITKGVNHILQGITSVVSNVRQGCVEASRYELGRRVRPTLR